MPVTESSAQNKELFKLLSAVQNPRFGWRQSVVATLKANTYGIRFDFCAGSAHRRKTMIYYKIMCFLPARSPAPCIYCDLSQYMFISVPKSRRLRGNRF
jgi:hypothetical protein